MTNRKPTPLKDEKPDPIEGVHEQLAELIAAVNSLAEKGNATAERQPDERFQKTLSTAVVKAVQDLLEARQRKFEEADKGKMTINEILQEILSQYDDICGKAKGFYQIYQGADACFKHIDENLQKISGNQKILYGMMKSVQQAHNIKSGNEHNRPASIMLSACLYMGLNGFTFRAMSAYMSKSACSAFGLLPLLRRSLLPMTMLFLEKKKL